MIFLISKFQGEELTIVAATKPAEKSSDNSHLRAFLVSYGPESYVVWSTTIEKAIEFNTKVRERFGASKRPTEKKELSEESANERHSPRPTTAYAEGKVYFKGRQVWPF